MNQPKAYHYNTETGTITEITAGRGDGGRYKVLRRARERSFRKLTISCAIFLFMVSATFYSVTSIDIERQTGVFLILASLSVVMLLVVQRTWLRFRKLRNFERDNRFRPSEKWSEWNDLFPPKNRKIS